MCNSLKKMFSCFNGQLSKFALWLLRWVPLISLLIGVVIIVLVCVVFLGAHFLPFKEGSVLQPHVLYHNELSILYYLAIVLLTLGLAMIAWFQLGQLSKTVSSDYLLKIDERFHGCNSIRARRIIHALYIEAEPDNKNSDVIWNHIGEKIRDMRLDSKKIWQFVCLREFLDFFETLGNLYVNDKITVKEIDDLMGYSILKFYKIFEPYIRDRRRRRENYSLYCDFEKLFDTLKQYQK